MLQTFRGKVWLTETGGIVKLGLELPVQHEPRGQGAGLHVHPGQVQLAHPALFVYQFNSPPNPSTAFFDAGLINPDNSLRPGYDVVKTRKARSCHK